MSYYFIAHIQIHNEIEYKKYTDKVTSTVTNFNGEYLAVDTDPAIIEGQSYSERCVIISFPTKNDFENWYNSKEYQNILPIRLNSANCRSILVRGISQLK